jgi:hypothetical protein
VTLSKNSAVYGRISPVDEHADGYNGDSIVWPERHGLQHSVLDHQVVNCPLNVSNIMSKIKPAPEAAPTTKEYKYTQEISQMVRAMFG